MPVLQDTCSTAGCDGGHTATGNGAEDTAHIEFPSNQPSLPGRRCKQNLTEVTISNLICCDPSESIAMTVRSGTESSETAAAKEMESSTWSPRFSMHKPSTSADTIGFFEHSGSGRPLYVPPCAWYYLSHHEVSHPFGDQDSAASGDNEARVSVHGRDEKDQSLIVRVGNEKEDALVSKRTHKDEKMVKMPPSTSKEKSKLQRDKGLLEKLQACSPGESSSTSSAAAAAAATEARKRRKQLTKLKHNHGSWGGKQG
ncbi:hypothetical protein BHE74_00036690 [Ensete ventricosum]|uniref:Uncharacterized protein n=1 Tax=Ensete ventricosum TaxID=4639 RepID=A0A444CUQ2_ENSVE|nr:hypothetical protein GW17_00048233 [Ensete ventricosum]RWW56583.1 hypothetical protein BHE74_00036690 [Ensete ventricosum]RZR75193.1 hypothetical protein BHM03_00051550 [Ensete ventricosum]